MSWDSVFSDSYRVDRWFPVATFAPRTTPATEEALAEALYQNQLLKSQNTRLKAERDRARQRIRRERQRGDRHYETILHQEAQIEFLRGEYFELLDEKQALMSENISLECALDMCRLAERDPRRRGPGHGGVMGSCCPYSGRRALQRGAVAFENDEEWDDDCFSCCPCCWFSDCNSACGMDCGSKRQLDSESEDEDSSGRATPPSGASSGDERELDDDDNGDDVIDDGLEACRPNEAEDEYGSGLERDLDDTDADGHVEDPEETPKSDRTDDVYAPLGAHDNDDEGYEGGTEMSDTEDDYLEQVTVAGIAPSSPLSFFPVRAAIPTQDERETTRQLLMEIVNNTLEGSCTNITSQDKQLIVPARGTGKLIEGTAALTSPPAEEDHGYTTSAAIGFLNSGYLRRQISSNTIYDSEDENGYVSGLMVGQGHVGLKWFYQHFEFAGIY
ncbi:hypothetical protein V8F20_010980 [Naviculisporaceae sp. PSN 640]